jgi:transmembrane sensor
MKRDPRPDERPSREAQAWHARLRGEPSASDRDAFMHWYADPANRTAYDRIDRDWSAAYGLLRETKAGRGRSGLTPPVPRLQRARYGWALASLAIVLFASLLLFRPGSEPVAQAEVIATAVGEIRTVRLPDRSEVTLDTDSRIAVQPGDRELRVDLQRGRVRFKVRADPARPFVVATRGGEIVARGTTFDVHLRQEKATVALIEGRVEVKSRTVMTSRGRALRPGDRVAITPEGLLEEAVPVTSAELRWPTGMIVFENTPLAQVAAEANRYSQSRIVLGDVAAGRLRVTGTYRAGDTIGLARSLAAAFALTLQVMPSGEILLRSGG